MFWAASLARRNADNEDLMVWGPRPEPCKLLVQEQKAQNMSSDDMKAGQQQWYNKNKGLAIQQ